MGDIGLVHSAREDKTAQMQAARGAIDELMPPGALEDHVSGQQDYIQQSSTRQRDRVRACPGCGRAAQLEFRRRGRSSQRRGGYRRGERPRPASQEQVMACDSQDSREGQFEVDNAARPSWTRSNTELDAAVEAGDDAAFKSR